MKNKSNNKAIQGLINKLSHLLHLDIRYFARGTFFTGTQQIIGLLCGFGVTYILGNFVTRTAFGEYNLVLSTISLITFLSLPGMDTALLQSVGKGYDKSFTQAIRMKITFALWGSLALLAFTLFYFFSGQKTVAFGIGIIALLYPLLYSFSLTTPFLTAKRYFKELMLTSSFSSIVFLITVALSVGFTNSSVGLVAGYAFGLILPGAMMFLYAKRFIKKASKVDPQLHSYSKFLTGISVFPWISNYIGQIFLGILLGPQVLAVFAIANSLLASAQKSFTVFYKPITAKIASQSKSEHQYTLITHGLRFILLGFALSIMLWFITPFVIHIFFPSYLESIQYAKILSLALIPLPLAWILNDMVVYQKIKRTQVIAATIPHFAKIILYLILIPKIGIWGLVFVTLFDRLTAPLILVTPFAKQLLKN